MIPFATRMATDFVERIIWIILVLVNLSRFAVNYLDMHTVISCLTRCCVVGLLELSLYDRRGFRV